MADLDTSSGGGSGRHQGKVRSKKLSTRVDLTPMVDLAFLLISFFMLTTTMAKPVAMQLAMPQKPKEEKVKEPVKESQVITFILDENDVVWYYEGLAPDEVQKTTFSPEGLRKVILDKQKKVGRVLGDPKKTIALIKMTPDAVYKNLIDILDEMDITQNEIFAIQDLMEPELAAVKEAKGE
jgi:biopolymer transport protein ExbD